jgi:hypothetical protein
VTIRPPTCPPVPPGAITYALVTVAFGTFWPVAGLMPVLMFLTTSPFAGGRRDDAGQGDEQHDRNDGPSRHGMTSRFRVFERGES